MMKLSSLVFLAVLSLGVGYGQAAHGQWYGHYGDRHYYVPAPMPVQAPQPSHPPFAGTPAPAPAPVQIGSTPCEVTYTCRILVTTPIIVVGNVGVATSSAARPALQGAPNAPANPGASKSEAPANPGNAGAHIKALEDRMEKAEKGIHDLNEFGRRILKKGTTPETPPPAPAPVPVPDQPEPKPETESEPEPQKLTL